MIPMTVSEIATLLGGEIISDNRVVTGVSTDSRAVSETEVFVALVGERFDAHDFLKNIKCAVAVCEKKVSGLSFPQIIVKSSLEALGKIASYSARKANLKLRVGLTGSVGKTTTKEMCALVLQNNFRTRKTEGNFNNHIGVPKTLLSVTNEDECLVCEMGMSHSGEISYLASLVELDVAIITNIGNSHIENLKTRENIALAKLEIVEGLKPDGTLILNGDEPLLENINIAQNKLYVGFSGKCQVRAESVVTSESGVEFVCHAFDKKVNVRLPLPGRHNVYNALFAIALGCVSGIRPEVAALSLEDYTPVGMRQKIYQKDETLVIADCYNAGVESMCASLEALKDMKGERHSIAVLGDMLELGEMSEEFHRKVGKKAAECGIDTVLTFGNFSRFISEEACANVHDTYHFATRQECANKLLEYKKCAPIVLFKASHSMKCEEIIELCGLLEN